MARNGPYRTGPAPKAAPEVGRLPRNTAAHASLPPDHHLRRSRRVGRNVATAGLEVLRVTTAPRAGMLPTTVIASPFAHAAVRPAAPPGRGPRAPEPVPPGPVQRRALRI